MTDEERIADLDHQLISLGPETHRLKTQTLPSLIKQCRELRQAGQHQEADAVADRIEKLDAIIKLREKQLKP